MVSLPQKESNSDELIKKLEDEITNLEGVKYHCNVRFDDAIERQKKIRFELKYKK